MTLTARPTTYKGVAMRSRLEARAAAFFDALGLHWTYEPRAYAGPEGQYLPDFQIGARTFIEVKPAITEEVKASHTVWERLIRLSVGNAELWILNGDGWAAQPGKGGWVSGCGHGHVTFATGSSDPPNCASCLRPITVRSWELMPYRPTEVSRVLLDVAASRQDVYDAITHHAQSVDLRTTDGRKQLVDAVLPIIHRVHPTDLEYSILLLGRACSLSPEALLEAARHQQPVD